MLAKTIGAKAIGNIEVFTKKYLLGKTKFHQEMLHVLFHYLCQ
jgi:hypothetical protein